ncbi:MAG TPA: hypothetical protein VGG54_22735 [Trebonia sp.]|jgi:hypothetical protein
MTAGPPPSAALPAGDVVPLVNWWLGQHQAVAAAITPGHVSMWNEPPWPDLVVTDTTAGADGDLIWLTSPEIQLEAYGDLDGNPGKAALRKLVYTALGALMELCSAPYPYEGAPDGSPVVTWVQSSRAGGYVPLPSGQPRYVAAVRLFVHPPN